MAIELGIETETVSKEERTWRVELFCEKGEDPTIRAHREIVTLNTDGKVIARDRDVPVVARHLSVIANKSFTFNSKTYTAAELAGVIAAVADTLRQEDQQVTLTTTI
jgi:hypothetical protein